MAERNELLDDPFFAASPESSPAPAMDAAPHGENELLDDPFFQPDAPVRHAAPLSGGTNKAVQPSTNKADYGNMGAGEVGSRMYHNLPRDVKETITPLVEHPVDALKGMGQTLIGLPVMAADKSGLYDYAANLFGGHMDHKGLSDFEAPASNLIGHYKDILSSKGNFKEYMAEHPFQFGLDALTVASPVKGVAGALGKGAVPADAVARAAVLRDAGMQPLRHLITGERPPVDAADAIAKRVAENNASAAASAAELTGSALPEQSLPIAAIDRARVRSLNNIRDLYTKAYSHEGMYDPSVGGDNMIASINANLQKSGNLPEDVGRFGLDVDDVDQKSIAYPQSQKAIQTIKNALPGPATPDQVLSLKRMEHLRQALLKLQQQADGLDAAAMHNIIDSYTKHLEDAARSGKWIGENGDAVASDMATARAANRSHREMFDNSGSSTVRNIVGKLEGRAKSGRTDHGSPHAEIGDDDFYSTLHPGLSKTLLNDSMAGDTYNKLTKVLGKDSPEMADMNKYIRQLLLESNPKLENLKYDPHTIRSQMENNAAMRSAFSPDEAARVQALMSGHLLNNTKLPKGPLSFGRTMKDVISQSLHGLPGKLGAAAVGHGIGGPFGAVVGYGILDTAENVLRARRAAKIADKALSEPKQGMFNRAVSRLPSGKTAAEAAIAGQESRDLAPAPVKEQQSEDYAPIVDYIAPDDHVGIANQVRSVAHKYGVDEDLVLGMAGHESGFENTPRVNAKTSHASGVFQLGDDARADYLKGDRYDAVANIDAGVRDTRDNVNLLKKKGFEINPENVYTLMFLGPAGGTRFLNAPRNDPSINHVGRAAYVANKSVFDGRSVGDVINLLKKAHADGLQIAHRYMGRMSVDHFANVLDKVAPGAQITSGYRTAKHNAEVGGVSNSMHLTGHAADVVLPEGMSEADFKQALLDAGVPITQFLGQDYAIAHGEGPHVHVGWAPKRQAATGGRIGRASGGRTLNPSAEADRLIQAAETSKRKHNNATKPLLAIPDEHITKALSIANESV